MKTKLQIIEKKVIRLSTQAKRAKFALDEMKRQGLTVTELADRAGKHWMTVARFLGLDVSLDPTKNPATDTTKDIFHSLGYDLCFTKSGSQGTIEL